MKRCYLGESGGDEGICYKMIYYERVYYEMICMSGLL